jgi:Ras-related protein Rab-1A
VPYPEAKELADHFNVRFLETSAKESLNVEDAFTTMTREIKAKVATNAPKRNAHEASRRLTPSKKLSDKKKGGCC